MLIGRSHQAKACCSLPSPLIGSSSSNSAAVPIPLGTWAAGDWAVQFYQSKGFALIDEAEEKDRLLRTCWFCEVRFRLQSPCDDFEFAVPVDTSSRGAFGLIIWTHFAAESVSHAGAGCAEFTGVRSSVSHLTEVYL